MCIGDDAVGYLGHRAAKMLSPGWLRWKRCVGVPRRIRHRLTDRLPAAGYSMRSGVDLVLILHHDDLQVVRH